MEHLHEVIYDVVSKACTLDPALYRMVGESSESIALQRDVAMQ
jgi:hypothetical protein